MAKRSRNDTLTGGTGDVNPQILTTRVTESAADTTTTLQIALPIPQIPVGGKATIFELLRVYMNFGTAFSGTGVAETEFERLVSISTKNFGTTVVANNDPTVFLRYDQAKRGAFTAAGTYFIKWDEPGVFDFTDGAGHGMLIATQNIFAQIDSSNTGIVQNCAIRLLYRLKTATIEEYIGIVQSQQ